MVVNNNDLIEEAMKRYGIEPDRLFNLKINGIRYYIGFFAHEKDKKITEIDEFFFTKINGAYVFCDSYGRMKYKYTFSREHIAYILFSNNDIEINYVDKPIEKAKENNKIEYKSFLDYKHENIWNGKEKYIYNKEIMLPVKKLICVYKQDDAIYGKFEGKDLAVRLVNINSNNDDNFILDLCFADIRAKLLNSENIDCEEILTLNIIKQNSSCCLL